MSELTNGLCSNRTTETITNNTSISPTSTTKLSEKAVQEVELSEYEKNMIELEQRINEARKHNPEFDKLVTLCENGISDWIDKVNAKNDLPSKVPKAPILPCNKTIKKIIIPSLRISPNETSILLKYLKYKYIKGKLVGGDYFCIKKCFFSSNLHLSTKVYY